MLSGARNYMQREMMSTVNDMRLYKYKVVSEEIINIWEEL